MTEYSDRAMIQVSLLPVSRRTLKWRFYSERVVGTTAKGLSGKEHEADEPQDSRDGTFSFV